MVICFIALPVAAAVSVFSAKYRPLAAEAFDCVFKKMTFRKCRTGLDVKLKTSITSLFLKKNKKAGKFIFNNFELLSWLFIIITTLSMGGTIYGGINYYLYGNCNGPVEAGFCIFDPSGHSTQTSELANKECSDNNKKVTVAKDLKKSLNLIGFNSSLFPIMNKHARSTMVLVACYDCDYSRELKPTIDQLMKDKTFNLIFAHFPVQGSSTLASRYGDCIYRKAPELFWKYNNVMFSSKKHLIEDELTGIIEGLGLNKTEIKDCANSEATQKLVIEQEDEIKKVGIYGTPTVFIDGEPIVGPKPYRVYARLIKDE
ncbi:MAG: thioredoxin domain-containing protein [bacterium]